MKQCICLFIHRTAALVFVFLVACQPSTPILLPPTLPPHEVVVRTMTPSPAPAATLTPSPTPTVKELIYPYTIDGLRQHHFQSGKIHIRSILDDKNQFYSSYLIDYPSDGLTITGVMQIPVGKGPFPVIIMNR